MSEHITHTAVTDDCTRLALHSPAICRAFKRSLQRHLDIARLAGVTRSGGNFMVRLLTEYREKWQARKRDDVLEEKLAFVLGWHCHRAADLQMKPIFASVDKDCKLNPTDCSVYHDVFLFREVYASGRREPYSPATLEIGMESAPAAGAFRIEGLEEVFGSVWQQHVLGLHRFAGDPGNGDAWVERLFKTRQEPYVDLHRYAEAFRDPSPDRMKRFIHDINFYDRNDPVIRLARSIQEGSPNIAIHLSGAVEAAATQSQYAQALRKGYVYLRAASDYFEGRMDRDTFADRLERGKQGV